MKRMMKKIFFALLLCAVLTAGIPGTFSDAKPFVQTAEAAGSFKLNVNKKKMLVKETFLLSVKGADSSAISWKTSNKRVARVKKGKVTAVGCGTAYITAEYNGKQARCRVTVDNRVDLIIFAGQSNMLGHGNAAEAPKLKDGAGYEYKVVTARKKVLPLQEPFGLRQNSASLSNPDEICTGSMVTAFCNSYYARTRTPVMAVSAAKVGSGSVGWSTTYYKDVEKRIKTTTRDLKKMGIKVNHCYLVWMHGENDVCAGTPAEDYAQRIGSMLQGIANRTKVERCMLIKTGRIVYNAGAKDLADASEISRAQDQICRDYRKVIMISQSAYQMDESAYRRDMLHFNQSALNRIGKEAGKNAGAYAKGH